MAGVPGGGGAGRLADDALQHPFAAQDRRRPCAVRRHLQDAGVRHHAAAMAVRRQLGLAQFAARDAGDTVMLGQPLIEERPVRVDELRSDYGSSRRISSKNDSVSRGIDQYRK